MAILPLRHRRDLEKDEGRQVSHDFPFPIFNLWFTSCSTSSLGSSTNLQVRQLLHNINGTRQTKLTALLLSRGTMLQNRGAYTTNLRMNGIEIEIITIANVEKKVMHFQSQ